MSQLDELKMSDLPFTYEQNREIYNALIDALLREGKRMENRSIMNHSQSLCEFVPELTEAIEKSIAEEEVLYEHGVRFDVRHPDFGYQQIIPGGEADGPTTDIVFSPKRTFEAALAYKGKKVAVLNFANNHHIGGSPWSANAQEECLCRVSTLYPCLCGKREEFYEYHEELYRSGAIGDWGNADMIYTPGVIVFKEDSPTAPKLLKKEDWYSVDVITCAAPIIKDMYGSVEYTSTMEFRIGRILSLAKAKGVEVLILGAFGCGAFNNNPYYVASFFKNMLEGFHFEKVEFAIYDRHPGPTSNLFIFKKVFGR